MDFRNIVEPNTAVDTVTVSSTTGDVAFIEVINETTLTILPPEVVVIETATQGPPGRDGEGGRFEIGYSNVTTAVIPHNLGFVPNIIVYDENMQQVEACVSVVTQFSAQVDFLQPSSGTIVAN